MQTKIQQEKEARFISRSLSSLQQKKKEKQLLILHMLQSTCPKIADFVKLGVTGKHPVSVLQVKNIKKNLIILQALVPFWKFIPWQM